MAHAISATTTCGRFKNADAELFSALNLAAAQPCLSRRSAGPQLGPDAAQPVLISCPDPPLKRKRCTRFHERYEQVLASDAALIGDAQNALAALVHTRRRQRSGVQPARLYAGTTLVRAMLLLRLTIARRCWPTTVTCPSAGRTAELCFGRRRRQGLAGFSFALPAYLCAVPCAGLRRRAAHYHAFL